MFHSRSSLSNDSPFCEVLIPVFTNSVATPVRLSIWTNVSVTPTGGGDSSYHATMCPRFPSTPTYSSRPSMYCSAIAAVPMLS